MAMTKIKTADEIAAMREGGRRLAETLQELRRAARPGVSTRDLDRIAEESIRARGDLPTFKGYVPHWGAPMYPATLCASINDVVVHGIPGDRILKEGDIIGLDLGLTHEGMIVDAAISVAIGKTDKESLRLIAVTEEALEAGISAARGGAKTGDVSAAIGAVAKEHKLSVVRELGGHGVGHRLHEDPEIGNFGTPGTGTVLLPGMTIAIEPIFTLGKAGIDVGQDGYTITTRDGSRAGHVEHTILITDGDPEILTQC